MRTLFKQAKSFVCNPLLISGVISIGYGVHLMRDLASAWNGLPFTTLGSIALILGYGFGREYREYMERQRANQVKKPKSSTPCTPR